MGLAAVDHVAAIDRQGLLADLLVRLGTRLGVLPGDAPDADHRPPAGQAQGAGQQFQHGGLARHVLGMVVVHVLGAVAALHHQRLGSLSRVAGENVGVYGINQGGLALNSGNYDLSYQGNNLTITKALLNVIADGKTKVYGDADPSLTYQVSGLKNGDSAGSILTGGLNRVRSGPPGCCLPERRPG